MNESAGISIREARKSDVARLVELMKALTITTSSVEAHGASTLAEYEKVFEQIENDPNHKLIVAEVDGSVVGSADLVIVPNLSHRGLPWAVMENVIVEEKIRRKGIAGAMVQYLVDLARENGCYKIGLSSSKERPAAHSFYESLGFKQYGLGYRIYFDRRVAGDMRCFASLFLTGFSWPPVCSRRFDVRRLSFLSSLPHHKDTKVPWCRATPYSIP